MRVRWIVAEDFCNYKAPSMFIISTQCDWKCCTEIGADISMCQNAPLVSGIVTDIPNEDIFALYHSNDITRAVVIGGLEPMLQIDEVVELISYFRRAGDSSPFVIYTGYNESEVPNEISRLSSLGGVIVKFGRYVPNDESHYDDVLGVTLASKNQYARCI